MSTLLNNNYWDCECKENFIHYKTDFYCKKCGAAQEDQPNSRQEEIDKLRVAYYVSPTILNELGEFVPVIVREGVKGYFPTDWSWGTNIEIAEECAKDKNSALGLSDEDVHKIILSSMF